MKKNVYLFLLVYFFINLGFSQQKEVLKPVVTKAVYFDVSPPMRDMVNLLPEKADNTLKERVIENYFTTESGSGQYPSAPSFRDPVLQDHFGSIPTDTTLVNVDGLGAAGVATISSGVYRFFGIAVLLDAKRHTSSRTTSMGVDHSAEL